MTASIPVLVITGPVGVGKTSVASAISDLLSAAHVPHAAVDMDWLRWCYPAPPDDRFRGALGLQNLGAVWQHYRAAGAERLIIADVVESRVMIADYQAVVPGAHVVIVRLHAALHTIVQRLGGRESGENLIWHQQRAAELHAQMERDCVEDHRIMTDNKSIEEIAQEVIEQIGWTTSQPRQHP
jgi:broad-specificity NMP kinase